MQSRISTLPRVTRGRDHEGAGLDAVGDDGVVERVQLVHALDGDERRAGTANVRPHLVEDARQLLDLGLAGRVFQGGAALGEGGRHHQVLGAGDGDHVEDDGGPAQPARPRA